MLKSLGEQSCRKVETSTKKFLPIFYRAPKSIADRKMEFSITQLRGNAAVATGERECLPADLILRSIGYKSSCADADIKFDAHRGHVCNLQGRVLKDNESSLTEPGLYVAGWLGTGPTGVILTTMNGAFSVAKTICDDIAANVIDTASKNPDLYLTTNVLSPGKAGSALTNSKRKRESRWENPRKNCQCLGVVANRWRMITFSLNPNIWNNLVWILENSVMQK